MSPPNDMRDPWIIEIEWLTRGVRAIRIAKFGERENEMSRLSEKLQMARGVVGRQTAKIEARADAIIAQEPLIEAQTDEAFAGHEAMLSEAQRGLDALKRELALVSNDPLGSSGGSPEVEQPPATFPGN